MRATDVDQFGETAEETEYPRFSGGSGASRQALCDEDYQSEIEKLAGRE